MSLTRSPLGPTVTLIAARVVSFAVTFFIPVILVRVFDQATFGGYKQIFLLYVVFYAIAQVGMAESLYYFIPANPAGRGGIVLNSAIILAISGMICLAALTACSHQVAARLGNPAIAPYVFAIGAFLLLMLMSAVLEIYMVSAKQYVLAAWTYFFSDILRSALLIIPAVMFRSLTALLAGALTFAALRFLFCIFYMVREFGDQLRIDWPSLRRQLSYALPFELAIIVDTLTANYHQYTVSHHFGAIAFAVYSIGCLQLPFVDFVAGPAANVMMVRMADTLNGDSSQSVLAIWRDTTRKLALVFFPLFALLLVSAREIILLLFTDRYEAAVPVFMLWATVVPLAVFQTESVMRVFARTRFILAVNVLRLIVIASLIGVSISKLGPQGAVLVTLIALAAAKGASLMRALPLIRARAGEILPWGTLIAISAASAAACLPALLVKTQMHMPLAATLAAMGVVFTLTYAFLLFEFDLLSEAERDIITSWLPLHHGRAAVRGVE